VYCLVVAGTIEEKIYQRQITKHALSHRILVNPYKKRLFKMKDIYDLFQLPRFPPLYEKMNSLQDYTHSDNYRLFKEYETLWAQYNEDTINTISSSPMTLSKLSYTKQVLLKPSSLIPTSPITSCLDVQIPKRKRCKLQKEQQECSNSTFLNSFSNDSSSKETLNKYSFSVNSIIQKDEDLSDDVLVNHLLKHNKIQVSYEYF
jgi:SNF2 family DNA or RNA helicase